MGIPLVAPGVPVTCLGQEDAGQKPADQKTGHGGKSDPVIQHIYLLGDGRTGGYRNLILPHGYPAQGFLISGEASFRFAGGGGNERPGPGIFLKLILDKKSKLLILRENQVVVPA